MNGQIEIGWLVMTSGGPMLWPLADRTEALTYCQDGAEPVLLYADHEALKQHEKAQSE